MRGRQIQRLRVPGRCAVAHAEVRRLIQISTAAYRDPRDGFDLKPHAFALLFKVIARKGYEDIKATGELIANSDVDWIPPRFAAGSTASRPVLQALSVAPYEALLPSQCRVTMPQFFRKFSLNLRI